MLSFILTNIVVQGLVAAAAWWLSGFDSKLSSDNTKGDIFRRVLRCVITLLLVEISFWAIWQSAFYHDRVSGFVYIATALPLAIMWCGCLSNLLAHGFQSLIDSNDKRGFDPNQETRILDSIGQLIRSGRKEEAIRICEALKASGEVSPTSLEFFLGHLGVAQAGGGIAKPLADAERLRSGERSRRRN